MSAEILNTAILAASFLILFGIAEILFHYVKIKVELTRKLVHIGTGILTLLFPVMLNNHWLVLFLCSSFACILWLSLKYNLLKSINAIERESVGSLAYPTAVYLTYLFYHFYGEANYYYFYLPILILAICDPLAALFGKKFPLGKYKVGKETKTIVGTSAFFVGAIFVYLLVCILLHFPINIFHVLMISFVSAFTEAFSKKGYDNLTIPLSVIANIYLLNELA